MCASSPRRTRTSSRRSPTERFREDLFYRLNVVRIQLPPLRERPEDIRLLAEYFLQKVAAQKAAAAAALSEEAVRVLESYTWPGNVRELENTIQRACALASSDMLLPEDIPLGTAAPTDVPAGGGLARPPVSDHREQAIEVLLRPRRRSRRATSAVARARVHAHAMKATRGNQVRAAKLLGITRATLRKRIERFAITKEGMSVPNELVASPSI